MGEVRTVSLSLLVVICMVTVANSFPRRKFIGGEYHNGNRRSSLISSALSDYWTERGFKDALTDHLLESESNVKDIMALGDEMDDFVGQPRIRIPRVRLTPPAPLGKSKRIRKIARRPRTQLTPATRKSDMEILESITLVDGGTQMPDGTIKIRQSMIRPQRKYHQEAHQTGPLSYYLPGDEASANLQLLQHQQLQHQQHQQQPPPQPRQPAPSFHTLPYAFRPLPVKPVVHKAHKSLEHPQFQNQLMHHEQPPQHSLNALYSSSIPTTTTARPLQPPKHIFVIEQPPRPQPQLTPHQHSPPPPPSPPRPILQQQKQPTFQSQAFQQQFQHPFETSEPGSFAKLAASLLSTASGVAASALSPVQTASPYTLPRNPVSPSASSLPSLPFSSSSGSPSIFSVLNSIPPPTNPIAASSQQSPQVLLPTTTPAPSEPTTLRLGVVSDDELSAQNQLIQPENLAARLTRIYETGRKILYFPKGVMDTVDTFLKQMERNPTVAYLGDKFFAKMFGDTSAT